MAKRGVVSTINAIARQQARQQRQLEVAARRQERERIRMQRETARALALRDKEAKQAYLSARIEEVDDLNSDLASRAQDLQSILEHTLGVNDTLDFDSLRILEDFVPDPMPRDLVVAEPEPQKQTYISRVKAPGLLQSALGLKGRYQRELQDAEAQYEAAHRAWQIAEQERRAKRDEFERNKQAAKQVFMQKVQLRDQEVDELKSAYQAADIPAVITYNTMVLERSSYPEGFPQVFRLAYAPESRELVIEYELPGVEIVPTVLEYKYSKSKDAVDEKLRKSAELKDLYQDVVSSIALRTIHEVFEADQCDHLDVVALNGYVHAVDPATGKDIRPYIISVRATKEQFRELNLARIDKRACLRNLGAQVSPQPQALQAVKPIVDFNMVDKRFVEQADVLSDLESRPNLMDLSPSEFEALVSNLFQKMGLETKLTRASRDGGVDAVAFDTRPILGGKVVIQAKRYRNTVGVSAVRDLFGTMMNEGANKGIIVSTSGYGSDAYEFAKDKPIEMIDGGGLLYLLDQVGVKARIIMPAE